MPAQPAESPKNSLEARQELVDTLRLDLVGPWAGHELAEEMLPGWVRPSNWYLTGFLIPVDTLPSDRADEDADEDVEAVPEDAGAGEESADDRKAAKKAYFPSSMGLSFLVAAETKSLTVTVRWGDYAAGEIEKGDGEKERVWRRQPREEVVDVPLAGGGEPVRLQVPESGGLELEVVERPVRTERLLDQIPAGTRSISIFLVNRRKRLESRSDEAYVFQPEVIVESEAPLVPRPDLRGSLFEDWDERVADLHYAAVPEYATGHGVAADWDLAENVCRRVRTTWVPVANFEKTATARVPGVQLSMEELGRLPDGPAAEKALEPLVERYREWIKERKEDCERLEGARRETAEELVRRAGFAADRIQGGIRLLAADDDALDAFRMANRSVARALVKRLGLVNPEWRPFQLAFILLNLAGLADPKHRHREIVDLLFFPTGGGKTEAYFGLAAFAIVLRRLRNPGEQGRAGAGVSVMMRYTLRLLTLDQLGRASGLVCALELERKAAEERYGTWPFEIGLWVGKAATPNKLGRKGEKGQDSARARLSRYKSDPRYKASPIPIQDCPWCGTRLQPESFCLRPNHDQPRELRVVCTNFECDFSGDDGLPIVAVDEMIYRRLPAFLIATIDKFAALPWVAESGLLLGGASSYDGAGFYGPASDAGSRRLAAHLPPPDLVIQDELHLIAGPLGTMAGLYETAIEALCLREVDGEKVRPKIVASTATARRAGAQVHALFAREVTEIFPPPGPDRRDSFFACVVPPEEAPARLYVGLVSPGRSAKVMLRKVWLALMAAGERAYRQAGGTENHQNPADPYMTVLGYFNSLRELGGSRRILEEEVQNTVKTYGMRKRVGETHGLFRDRKQFSEVLELTSRVSTDQVSAAKRRLEKPFHQKGDRVDCAIATNMISVGLDIPRLGLMVVLGQPTTHAEYIQATSRVGRDDERPGLVVTLFNIAKPRDRSHYERFRHYHESFYRAVEVASVTPFAARALDRGFAGSVVGLARHAQPGLTPPRGVEELRSVRAELEQRLIATFHDRVERQPIEDEAERQEIERNVRNRIVDLLDSWLKVVDDYAEAGVRVQYQKYELDQPKPLLRDMLDEDFESEHHRKFRASRSLRDVEPAVNLFLSDLGASRRGNRA